MYPATPKGPAAHPVSGVTDEGKAFLIGKTQAVTVDGLVAYSFPCGGEHVGLQGLHYPLGDGVGSDFGAGHVLPSCAPVTSSANILALC